jgi:hypothetical protein
MIALCTVLCGGQSAVDMSLFVRAKEPFLRGLLKLEKGLPSHRVSKKPYVSSSVLISPD